MGYDCTLHLIDEDLIRREFEPKLLDIDSLETLFDKKRNDSKKLWQAGREALQSNNPEESAALICQLAVIFSAASLPYHSVRGIALALWPPDSDSRLSKNFPEDYTTSPQVLFPNIVKTYPALNGQFPTTMEGNFCTGIFIPASKVPNALAWLEKQGEKLPEGPRRRLLGELLAVLSEATSRKLAYWEGTDLPLPASAIAKPEVQSTTPVTKERFELPTDAQSYRGGDRSTLLFARSPSDSMSSVLVNISSWPPNIRPLKDVYIFSAMRGAEKDWLLYATRPGEKNLRFLRYTNDLTKPEDGIELTAPMPLSRTRIEWETGLLFGSRAILFPKAAYYIDAKDVGNQQVDSELASLKKSLLQPFIQKSADSTALIQAPGLEATQLAKSIPNFVRLHDGSNVLIWNGNGYEWIDERFHMTFKMQAQDSFVRFYENMPIPTENDGFYYVSNRILFEIHRGQSPVQHLKRFKNIMQLRPGPEGALLFQEGDNDRDDAGNIYFPSKETVIYLGKDSIGFDQSETDDLFWAASRLIIQQGNILYSIPETEVLKAPAYHAKTGRQLKK